jgi:CO/xanthine dehydrogenase FAD-binding subunit
LENNQQSHEPMKAAPLDFHRPDTADHACACLASYPDTGIIAGGQSLVPMLTTANQPSAMTPMAMSGDW